MKSKLLPLILSALFFAPALLFAGVLNENKLDRISVGMSAEKVILALGEPDLRRVEGKDGEGKMMERLQYTVARRLKDPLPNGDMELKRPLSFMLADDALVRIEK